jgi:hypothetical protein
MIAGERKDRHPFRPQLLRLGLAVDQTVNYQWSRP